MADSRESDILFKDATVIDGLGTTPGYLANVIIRGDNIRSITGVDQTLDVPTGSEIRVVDCQAGRYCLSPGFIDMHAHSDLSLLHTPKHLAKITQGVTTEVIGQDGISYAPVDDAAMAKIRRQIAGWNGNPKEPADFFNRWRSVEGFLNTLDAGLDGKGIATNAIFLVPQGNLRILTVGYENRTATQSEIDRMKALLIDGLEQGAVGMSSGLTYVPGMFADGGELAQLCEILKQYDAYYCPHHRSYGKGAMEAYVEMIELARQTGVRLHLTHATLNFPENAGRAEELLVKIDQAIADGVDITLDTYPYLPGSTTLGALLPSWVSAHPQRTELLTDPEQLKIIRHQCLVEGTDGCHGCTLDWNSIEIGGVLNRDLTSICVGKRIQQIADARNEDPFDTFIWLLKADDFGTTILQHMGNESNVRKIMRHPRHTGGSDGILTSTKPHPRGWGTFPRYLGHYHRDLSRGKSRDIYSTTSSADLNAVEPEVIFPEGLEEVVSHFTYRAVKVLRLQDRGLVKEGYKADLVLFDPEEVRDRATFADPQQPAQGIRTVLVNGVFAVDEFEATGGRAGRTVRMRKSGEGWVVR
ncbi:putative D-aminoacylase [Teratosphaeria nubilosa]|uniref:Putative D-aminoacylase n=1 Tax=Teratosphaeria nubilosa TaxID=161662 RepID=A0A6G1KT73_9PEZI|nr:putative D-aminoacylase [Teratosphaeria nubilosa]